MVVLQGSDDAFSIRTCIRPVPTEVVVVGVSFPVVVVAHSCLINSSLEHFEVLVAVGLVCTSVDKQFVVLEYLLVVNTVFRKVFFKFYHWYMFLYK